MHVVPIDGKVQTREAVRTFAGAHGVSTNPLLEKGFASIGYAPCTRALRPASRNAPGAGGGKTTAGRSAACTLRRGRRGKRCCGSFRQLQKCRGECCVICNGP